MVGLFRSLNTSDLALRAQSTAIQTTAHNIANANTPGFHRQRVEFVTTLPQDMGSFQVGTGVQVERVRRIVDEALEASLRLANSSQAALSEQADALAELEAIFNEFNTADLSSSLQNFQNSIEELITNPESIPIRQTVVAEGQALVERVSFIANRINSTRQEINTSIETLVGEANDKIERIADLNRQIVLAENGGLDFQSAADLRDRRDLLISDLSEIMDVTVREDSRGAATITTNGQLLVFGGRFFALSTQVTADREVQVSNVVIDGSIPFPTDATGGRLGGLINARDDILVEFVDSMDRFAKDLIFEFNKAHSEGRGLSRYQSLTSEFGVVPPNFSTVPLATNGSVTIGGQANQLVDGNLPALATGDDFFNGLDIEITSGANRGQRRRIVDYDQATGTLTFDRPFDNAFRAGDAYQITSLPFRIQNGSFELIAVDESSGTERTFVINLDLDGLGGAATDTKLDDVITQINAGFGAFVGNPTAASRTNDGKLVFDVRSTNFKFAFANDSSNLLAAMGINTFFSGRNALEIGINDVVEDDPAFLAAARSNFAGDASNAQAFADLFASARVANFGTQTLDESLSGILSSLGIQGQSARDLLENQTVLTANLLTQQQAVSGVSLDEEGTNLIRYQRAFQASARMIAVIDELLATLINSI